jgi:hypothetical protein
VAVVTVAAAGVTGMLAEACTTCDVGATVEAAAGDDSDFIVESCDSGVAALALPKVVVCSCAAASLSRFGSGIVAVDISRCRVGATTECSPALGVTVAAAWPE